MHFHSIVQRIVARSPLPLLPEPVLPGLKCEDHLTFAVPPSGVEKFISFWRSNHFRLSMKKQSWQTTSYPAEHIGLTMDGEVSDCADMIGLSVPLVENSPLNRTFELHGDSFVFNSDDGEITVPGVPQHVAYCLAADRSMWEAREHIEALGFQFITPVLEYTDDHGAVLRQSFFGCEKPYGPFAELIQRVPGPRGEPFRGFSPTQIDDLYHHYVDYSESLLGSSRTSND